MSKTKDERIDMLLTFMKDEIESGGDVPSTVRFDFNIDKGEDYLKFKEKTKLNGNEIQETLKVSYSRGYIKHPYVGGGEIYSLTTEGHGRAISFEAAKSYSEKPQQQNVTIGAIHGPAQIGNNNTQNIEGIFEYVLTEINNSEATVEQKEEAKSLLQKALEHPITNSIIGASVGAVFSKMSGGN